ncbi:MAG: hypothetical protein SFY81_00340 [Verrucomicrobiota bacterium]|nr:hypothetical protein [Verrucomicrobiota bacterium]
MQASPANCKLLRNSSVLQPLHGVGSVPMKLQQGQVWKTSEYYLRIVHLERLEVKYKQMADPGSRDGTHHHVSKKEFCRLIKGAALQAPRKSNEPQE